MCIRDSLGGERTEQGGGDAFTSACEYLSGDDVFAAAAHELSGFAGGEFDLFAGAAEGFGPVSYTHLDVYKRQGRAFSWPT